MELEDISYMDTTSITTDALLRWSATIQPIPFPEYMTPRSGVPLRDTPLEALMTVSPHLIAHVQRTASQGGLQTVSPRQVPFCKTMLRVPGGARMLGDHVVGSIADEQNVWPTIDDDDMSQLLPDEPLPSAYIEHSIQPKTKTTPLTKANKLLTDPILSCLIKGRAVVDILRRDDVAGDADAVLQLLAAAWGIPIASLAELDAYTLGIEGPLLRHAIKSDEVYPMMYAPIHIRKVISTGASEVTRQLLPEDTAMDWKRARVFCEAVFSLSISIEGHNYMKIRTSPPPGDPAARTDRAGVLVFQPGPASAWTFAAQTFSIYPIVGTTKSGHRGIPREVMEALTKYVDVVRPVSHALVAGHRAVARKATAKPVTVPVMETIAEGYRMMVRSLAVGSVRGKTAAATVRHLIYETMANAAPDVRLRMSRYLTLAREESKTHLGLETVSDALITKLAGKFLVLGEKIRAAVVAEAARRGATAEEWWHDILSQAPTRYAAFVEGTHGWTKVALWLLFRGPTEKWDRLMSAVKISALRDAAAASASAVPLPAKKGSVERLLAATRHTVKEVTRVFAAYYTGVAEVGLCIADEAMEQGKPRTSDVLKEASYLWMLRARCYRGANITAIAHDEPLKSELHYRIHAEPVDLVLVPSPYRAFQAYVHHVENSEVLSTEVKRHFTDYYDPPISNAFLSLRRTIAVASSSVVTRYLLNPQQLGADMEKSWGELVSDVARTARLYGAEESEVVVRTEKRPAEFYFEAKPLKMAAISTDDYYATLAKLEGDTVDWVEEIVDNLDPVTAESITERNYSGPAELLAVVRSVETSVTPGCVPGAELTH